MNSRAGNAAVGMGWSAVLSVALVLAMLVAAMIPWWPTYESGAFFIAAGTAIVAGAVIGVAGARFRAPAWAVVLAVVTAYLVLGVAVAVPDRALFGLLPTPAGLAELVAGAALSWKQLVTIAVPVGSYQALLVPPFLLGLIASTSAVTIALRSRRPALAVLPPAALLLAGIALGVMHSAVALEAGLAFFVTAVAWLARIRIAQRRRISSGRPVEATLADARRVVGASALIAVALIGATAAAFVVPMPARTVVRSELQPPFEPQQHDSPLAGFRTAFGDDVAEQPMLEVRGLPARAGLRVAVLDSYDGIVYSVGGDDGNGLSGRFSRVPYRLDQPEDYGEEQRIEVSILGYDDVWVPGIGRLERIDFAGPRSEELAERFFYNDVTGTAAVQQGLRDGDRYTAVSMVPVPPRDISVLRPGTSVLPPMPELPGDLEDLLDEWAPAANAEGPRLAAVIEGFHRGYVSHGLDGERSRSGHALDRIAELASERPMVGDGEQYAVAAALMARRIGFPARVVVGYLRQPGTEYDVEADVVRFRSGDRQAWIEVQTSGGEWVAVDPNPPLRPIPEKEPDQPQSVSRPQSALPPPAERTPVDDDATKPDASTDDPSDGSGAWLDALFGVLEVSGFVLLAVAAIVSPFLAVMVAKLRRRRLRRRADTAVERIEGGWREFADSASDYGYAIVPNATRAEQAAMVGGLGPLVLASAVDRAVFAPGGPEDGDDRRVWETVDELQRRLGETRRPIDRLRAAISLRSLGGYAVTRRGARS
ncbi:transglutaminase domain-containing protein [Agromyces italicus]|uniref:transglutaminase domain-containing protein n=1 Tax=Agromyces italicus TaxID=279572 RepID=UPI000A042B66|nr:transglutaminase domain-containing protein [Agromyces italicus]